MYRSQITGFNRKDKLTDLILGPLGPYSGLGHNHHALSMMPSPWHRHCRGRHCFLGDQQDLGDLVHHAHQGNLSRPRKEGKGT